MSFLPNSNLENHPAGTADVNPIINGNWGKLNNWINPAFGLTGRQENSGGGSAGDYLRSSGNLFTSDDVGATIRFANGQTAVITSYTSATEVRATDSKLVTSQSFTIYRTSETEKSAIARGLCKRVRFIAGDDGKIPVWNNTKGYFELATKPGYGVTAGRVLFGAGSADPGSSADLSFDDSTDVLTCAGAVVAKRTQNGHATITSAASIALDLNQEQSRSINTLAHDVTFTTSNLAAGRSLKVRIVCDGTGRNFTWPSWKWSGTAPASIAANKTGLLVLEAFGSADSDVFARWFVEA